MVGKLSLVRKVFGRAVGKISRRIRKPKVSEGLSSDEAQKKVLMFGWELPPFNSGGLGVACYEMANSISKKNAKVTFVLPRRHKVNVPFMKVDFADNADEEIEKDNLNVREVNTVISPYMTAKQYEEERKKYSFWHKRKFSSDLMGEVDRYGRAAAKLAKREKFDVIHAHDWLSFPAGISAKKVSKKPLIAHVHATEYDRCHEKGVNPAICAIERQGLQAADKVVAVSGYTKDRIIKFYDIEPEKIEVVHNGITMAKKSAKKVPLGFLKTNGKKMVLFVGRITYQKGVDYLIKAAGEVVKRNPDVNFMIVGSGDMQHQIIEQAADLGISDKVFFPGFLRNDNLDQIYRAADVYVMPSVSEPFGIVALEALSNRTPVIISNQSGVAEVVEHALKVDFWDTDELANKILAVLKNPSLKRTLSVNGFENARACSWDVAAEKLVGIYNSLAAA